MMTGLIHWYSNDGPVSSLDATGMGLSVLIPTSLLGHLLDLHKTDEKFV